MAAPHILLFPTCIVDASSPDLGRATRRVLERLGYRVTIPSGVTCCGQPAWNSGFAEEAASVAATTLDALVGEPDARVCVPAGSCATMMRVYWPELFRIAGDTDRSTAAGILAARVREFSELVTDSGPLVGRYEMRVAYHRSCHMLRELGIDQGPIDILRSLDGCEIMEWRDDLCCGFGGTFAVKEPEVSVAMADAKIDSFIASGAEELVGCDKSCLLQMESRMRRRGIDLPVRHLAQVLDEALV